MKRFNTHDLAALSITAGLGHKPTYTSEQHVRMLAKVQREPNREKNQTATRSLMLLQTTLRKEAQPPRGPRNDSPGVA